MAGKNKKKIVLTSLSAFLAAAMLTMSTVFAFDKEENSRQHEQLEQENSEYQEELKQTNKTIKEKEDYSKELQDQITELTKKIQTSNDNIKKLTDEISEKQTLIDSKLEAIEDRLALLRSRLRAIYTAGDISSLEIILQAKDFSDFIDKMELVQSISAYDDNLIQGLQEEMEEISAEQQKLKDSKEQIEKEKKQLEADKTNVNELSKENQKIILELKKTKEDTEDAIKENEERQAELEKALAEYNKEMAEKLRLERIKKMQEQAAQNRALTGEDNQIVVESDGSYVWPCPGHTYLTSLFEEWRGSSNHGALDIADGNIYGEKVVACWNGTVFSTNESCTHDYGKYYSCGCGGGYGNYVMIDHGDGKISIYGHLSGVTVVPGQEVVAGQLIGYVGSTGYSTGLHLHFEMRYNGVRYDPLTEYDR